MRSISASGTDVAFDSFATNLASTPAGAINGRDIYVRNLTAGTTTRVSVSTGGTQPDDYSMHPSISADGRYVAFDSSATDLIIGDTNGYCGDVFLRDVTGGTTTRLSESSGGTQGDGESDFASISADGRYVSFESWATNLVPEDTNNRNDVFAAPEPRHCHLHLDPGPDRFDTAIKISQAIFPGALPAGSGVVLAPGWESYQEALCGAPLAAA